MAGTYAVVLQIEKQNEGNINKELCVFQIEGKKKNIAKKNNDKRKGNVDKRNWICEYCKKKWHEKDICFKLNGTPHWYKEMLKKKIL